MKKLFLTVSAIFLLGTGMNAHPLHISIINVSIEGKVVLISISTFVDDWETAYFHYHSKSIDLTREENYNGNWFVNALKNSIQIREEENSDPLLFSTEKVTFDDLSMTIEMHGELRKAPKSLYIYNALLTDIFPDQNNLVIVSLNNKETGMKFDYKTKQEELKLR
jgi:hypothetical protein